jgi:GDP-mannose 6-dehydrogenase
VGTPGQENGSLDLTYVIRVFKEIGTFLREKKDYHWIILRSTVLPGTTRKTLIPLLEEISGKKAGRDFGICFNPEFLREGSSVYDFFHPPKTVIGLWDPHDLPPLLEVYQDLPASLFKTSLPEAEMVKYIDNIFHALKISFANEVGRVCHPLGLDSHSIMNLFIQDTKLNISPAYLKPGFAFGGSCLPKDTRALLYLARTLDVDLPLMQSILNSNDKQLSEGVRLILKTERKQIGIIGLSFKEGTDDLRESPLVRLAEFLLGKGFDLKIFDPYVSLGKLFGTNKEFIDRIIPHIGKLLVPSFEELLDHAQVIVVGIKIKEVYTLADRVRKDQVVIDLVRLDQNLLKRFKNYQGISW